MTWSWIWVYLFVLSAALSALLTSAARRVALRWKVLDQPGARKVHTTAKPLLGGVAMYLAFVGVVGVHWVLAAAVASGRISLEWLPPEVARVLPGVRVAGAHLRAILAGGTVIMLIGLLDDLWGIRPLAKLAGQIVGASVLVYLGVKATFFVGNELLAGLITVAWIVFVTNAFNLMDNMDGLSAGTAFVTAGIFFLVAVEQGQTFVSSILVVLAGCALGFLRYNSHPASIFMGDAGSLFLGFTIGSLTVLNTYYTKQSPTFLPVLMPLLILAVPIFDTASVIVLRLRKGQSIFRADKRHFSHRLVDLGFTQRQAVWMVYLSTLAVGLGAMLLPRVGIRGAVVLLIQAMAIIGLIVGLELGSRRRGPHAGGNPEREDGA